MSDWQLTLSQTVDAALAPATAAVQSTVHAYESASTAIDQAVTGEKGEKTTGELASEAAVSTARAVQSAASLIGSIAGLPIELGNTGIALATNSLAAAVGPLPAATMGALYFGCPHGHLHPPSLVPPSPVPIPLPSLGQLTLGCSVQVLIGGLPAARAGSIGMAPTCGGLLPMFNVFMASSNVFIGGSRAARITDICWACSPPICAAVAAIGKVMAGLQTAGNVALAAGAAGDLVEAATGSDAAVAAASGINAAMTALNAAAEAVAMAASALLGKDPAVPPFLPGTLATGATAVQIGGIPMPNTADIAAGLLNKVRGRRARLAFATAFQLSDDPGGPHRGCPHA